MQKNLMTQSSNKFQKTCFWFIFPIFGVKKFFAENLAVTHNLIWASSTMPRFTKINDIIQRECLDRQTDPIL